MKNEKKCKKEKMEDDSVRTSKRVVVLTINEPNEHCVELTIHATAKAISLRGDHH
jgi:hypothetical protein